MVTRGHQSHATVGKGSGAAREGLRPRRAARRQKSEQARSAKPCYGIGHRQRFPPKEPASHRESQCREADVKDFHMSHPLIAAIRFLATEGSRNRITDANLSPIPRKVNEPKVPYHCTKVTGLRCGGSGWGFTGRSAANLGIPGNCGLINHICVRKGITSHGKVAVIGQLRNIRPAFLSYYCFGRDSGGTRPAAR
jgi:hypothetical protein